MTIAVTCPSKHPLTQYILIHPYSHHIAGAGWNLHVGPLQRVWSIFRLTVPIWKAHVHMPVYPRQFQVTHFSYSHTSSHREGNPKPPALYRMSPNPFTQGLSIRSCLVCNALPRCHYCTITHQIPPVYYHYRSVSAIINDISTLWMKETIDWQRGGEEVGDCPGSLSSNMVLQTAGSVQSIDNNTIVADANMFHWVDLVYFSDVVHQHSRFHSYCHIFFFRRLKCMRRCKET